MTPSSEPNRAGLSGEAYNSITTMAATASSPTTHPSNEIGAQPHPKRRGANHTFLPSRGSIRMDPLSLSSWMSVQRPERQAIKSPVTGEGLPSDPRPTTQSPEAPAMTAARTIPTPAPKRRVDPSTQ